LPARLPKRQAPDIHSQPEKEERQMTTAKPGLYANIHAKQERIAQGSKEHMRKPSDQGAPSTEDFEKSKKTAKPEKVKK